jgi:hypothetical protein
MKKHYLVLEELHTDSPGAIIAHAVQEVTQ